MCGLLRSALHRDECMAKASVGCLMLQEDRFCIDEVMNVGKQKLMIKFRPWQPSMAIPPAAYAP